MLASLIGLLAQVDVTRTTTTTTGTGGPGALEYGMICCQLTFLGTFLAIMISAMWKIFVKAGQPGWAAIIPIYNWVVHLQIINQPLWLIVLPLIPCVNIIGGFVFSWILAAGTAKAFGKEMGFTIGLFLLPFIFYPILGFGSAQYIGPDGGSAPAPAPRPGVRR